MFHTQLWPVIHLVEKKLIMVGSTLLLLLLVVTLSSFPLQFFFFLRGGRKVVMLVWREVLGVACGCAVDWGLSVGGNGLVAKGVEQAWGEGSPCAIYFVPPRPSLTQHLPFRFHHVSTTP